MRLPDESRNTCNSGSPTSGIVLHGERLVLVGLRCSQPSVRHNQPSCPARATRGAAARPTSKDPGETQRCPRTGEIAGDGREAKPTMYVRPFSNPCPPLLDERFTGPAHCHHSRARYHIATSLSCLSFEDLRTCMSSACTSTRTQVSVRG